MFSPVDAAARKPRPKKPTVVTPDDAPRVQDDDDLSRSGTRMGVLEFSLGAVTAAVATTLVIYGSVQFYRGQQLKAFCEQPASFSSPECSALLGDPVLNARIAGGLSLGFAIPIAVASGFLFRRGVRINRDYRTFRRSAWRLLPYASRGQAGGFLHIQF